MSEETPAPAPEPVEEPVAQLPVEVPEPEAADELQSFEVPEEGRYVPIGAVHDLRNKVKELRPLADKAAALEQELADTRAKHQQSAPIIEAARAIVEAAQRQPQPQQHPVEDTSELEDVARDFDLWKTDGTPDLDKARRILAREEKRATNIAERTTAPLVVESLKQQAKYNLARAKNTKLADGTAADPEILNNLWGQLARQPGGLQTLANADNAVHVFNQALALTIQQNALKPRPQATVTTEKLPAPLYTESAGGQETALPTLTASDKRTAKDLEISEKEYAKTLANMPAGWGKQR